MSTTSQSEKERLDDLWIEKMKKKQGITRPMREMYPRLSSPCEPQSERERKDDEWINKMKKKLQRKNQP